ncbi:MAG: hypothetical protein Q4D02_07470 [Clostridia bacterium]|nr:hypothetical protein [Clostridia bacterium]
MSELLLIFFIVLFLIIISIFVFLMHVISQIKRSAGNHGFHELISVMKTSKEIAREEMNREKSVVGMTNLVLPQVVKEIPDFNVNMIYNTIESNLNKIFSALENQKYIRDDDLLLLEDTINTNIEDLKERNVNVRYDDIIFHKHALKRFENKNGVATLTTSSSLEYYYSDEKYRENSDIKRQTRYTCTFVYIFDYKKISDKNKEKLFVLHCPNCGAPLDSFSSGNCRYCMSQVGDVLAKTWKMASYKEDYKID